MRGLTAGLVLGLVSLTWGAEDKEAKPITPAEAAKQVNKQCTVAMEVRSTGKARGGGFIFLNSQKNFRDKDNFTVVIDKKSLAKFKKAGVADPAEHYKGKKVHVTGTVTLYNERPQIKVEDPKQIKIVEKKQ
jgi:DNA/RNA endonuclease YhcR with UshA esterase domain